MSSYMDTIARHIDARKQNVPAFLPLESGGEEFSVKILHHLLQQSGGGGVSMGAPYDPVKVPIDAAMETIVNDFNVDDSMCAAPSRYAAVRKAGQASNGRPAPISHGLPAASSLPGGLPTAMLGLPKKHQGQAAQHPPQCLQYRLPPCSNSLRQARLLPATDAQHPRQRRPVGSGACRVLLGSLGARS